MLELLFRGIFALLTFGINSTLLILYFSTIIGYSSKTTLHKDAFKIALPGTIVSSIFIFFNPLLPTVSPFSPFSTLINIGINSSIILWTLLTRRYCGTGWLSAIVISFVAWVINTLVMFFIYCFLFLTIKSVPV